MQFSEISGPQVHNRLQTQRDVLRTMFAGAITFTSDINMKEVTYIT